MRTAVGYAVVAWLVLVALLPLPQLTALRLGKARDVWLLGLGALAVVCLAWIEPLLGLIALSALAQWRGPEQIPAVIVHAAIIGEWLLVATLRDPAVGWLALGLAVVGCVYAIACVWQRLTGQDVTGWLGQRTLSAAPLVLAFPFLWPWLVIPLALALLVEQSWLAWIASAVAVTMMEPWTGFLFLLVGLVMLHPILTVARIPRTLRRSPAENTWLDRISRRGTSIDSLRARWDVWRILLHSVPLRGTGPGTVPRLLVRGGSPYGGHAHCDPLEYVVEFGALGAMVLVALIVRVGSHLHFGDPWSAAALAGAVLACGSYPLRVSQIGALWWAVTAVVATR